MKRRGNVTPIQLFLAARCCNATGAAFAPEMLAPTSGFACFETPSRLCRRGDST
jgi:hypothetical protein